MLTTPEERERQARNEVGQTVVTAPVSRLLTAGALVFLVGTLGWHTIADLRADPGRWPSVLDPRTLPPVWDEISSVAAVDGWIDALALANERVGVNIADYETSLEERSPLIDALVPMVNLVVTSWLGGSTESVYPGRGGWLFYRPDVEYVTGPGFLEPERLAARLLADPDVEPDPRAALIELRDALQARGIALVVVPVPLKPTIYPDRYVRRAENAVEPMRNTSQAAWLDAVRAEGIDIVDLTADFWQARQIDDVPLYLRSDTHWTPAGVDLASDLLADHIESLDLDWAGAPRTYSTATRQARNQGDTLALLNLPQAQADRAAERVTLTQVLDPEGQGWQPDPTAEILLLGDSFANIYSLEALGWGTAAGLTEQLSLRLGRPLDALRQNDAGSYATRQLLAAQRQQGRDRLAGKRLVIYQFASRELAIGDWRTGLPY